MTSLADRLRLELIPSTQLEELFFDAIVRLSTCASFLSQHIERDPELTHTETPRRMRLLLTTESKLRYAYEEFRRLKLARQLQHEDAAQAARPLLTVVASHTSRSGFRAQPRSHTPAGVAARHIQQLELSDAAVDARLEAAFTQKVETVMRPAVPGRNAQCPCNSGRKYKHCCANKQQAA